MQNAASQSSTRVCHVIQGLKQAGAETLVHTLAVGMRETRYAPLVCCMEGGPLAGELTRAGVVVECLNLERPSLANPLAFVPFVWRLVNGLRRVVVRHRVALLHAHMPDAIVWAAAVGTLERTAVVGTYHGLRVLPVRRSRLDPRNGFRWMLCRLAASASDRTIAVSPAVRQFLCEDLGFPEPTTVTVLNGVDTRYFASGRDDGRLRQELGLLGRRVILCVGRLNAGKGQAVLLDAFAGIARDFPDTALLLVGDGPDSAALRDRAAALGLADRLVMVPHRRDIPEILALAEVFVLPSFSEGISLSLLEALAAGRPVVTTDVPGNVAVLERDGTYARLVAPGDAGALAGAIAFVLASPERARAMAERGQGRVRERFDLATMFAATSEVYDRVLAERRERQQPS